jgi:hypothetical protein
LDASSYYYRQAWVLTLDLVGKVETFVHDFRCVLDHVPRSKAGVEPLVGYLYDLERSLPRNSDLYDAMPDGFEAAVRENIRLALTSLA